MHIGGEGSERWMVLVTLVVAAGIVTGVLGGPSATLMIMERFLYDAIDFVTTLLRR